MPERATEDGGDDIEERGLRRLEGVHDVDGGAEPEDVRRKGGAKEAAPFRRVVAQDERDEDAGEDDIAEAEHRKGGGIVVDGDAREEEFDWAVHILRHRHHHRCPEHPKNVIKEQSAQENAPHRHRPKRQKLDPLEREANPEKIVGEKMFAPLVPRAENETKETGEHLRHGDRLLEPVGIEEWDLRDLQCERLGLHVGRQEWAKRGREARRHRKGSEKHKVEREDSRHQFLREIFERQEEREEHNAPHHRKSQRIGLRHCLCGSHGFH
mmetsp:Transcript_31555/g.102822  ORF Transcript_31555/g.102822 Transcript_31555/m.102822 type:complete len:268 (-) Transcript_31555:180-983(-)